jgi:hypothetical protein
MRVKKNSIGYAKADAALAHSPSSSDFGFEDLINSDRDFDIVLPKDFPDQHAKFFRMIVAATISELRARRKSEARKATEDRSRKAPLSMRGSGAALAKDDAFQKGDLI